MEKKSPRIALHIHASLVYDPQRAQRSDTISSPDTVAARLGSQPQPQLQLVLELELEQEFESRLPHSPRGDNL
ncbi:hypothetical protein AWZ03_006260 [Drosophila navojoa]|uniref:Uncharacterized protein n=1 Tax=Drosophila navojoa TaxID=7232 RepID=A0A484BEK0_DRONA|nr:hypothetical protein AWZ03_006260 [Drosophila navojoa]